MVPVTICQDHKILLKITEYDYDLRNVDFEKYCRSRYGFCRPTDPAVFEQLCDPTLKKNTVLAAWPTVGKYGHEQRQGRTVPNQELETGWEIHQIQRGKLQDCWEIFSGKR